uniref:PXA domain-containing protein n=1 Tax=Angiostrongylus cantonensis TaxID=6313 RepID=A0A0K0CZ69_ANGCA
LISTDETVMKNLIVFDILLLPILGSDIVEGVFRNVLLSMREIGETVLYNISIPTSKDLFTSPALEYQLDSKSTQAFNKFLNSCPPAVPLPILTGTWLITYVSRRWLQTVLADVDEVLHCYKFPMRLSLNLLMYIQYNLQ